MTNKEAIYMKLPIYGCSNYNRRAGERKMNNKWEKLCECADFDKIYQNIKKTYGDEYIDVLNKIENEIEDYLNSTDKEIQLMVENNDIPYSVQWYVGMIDTDNFLKEYWL